MNMIWMTFRFAFCYLRNILLRRDQAPVEGAEAALIDAIKWKQKIKEKEVAGAIENQENQENTNVDKFIFFKIALY